MRCQVRDVEAWVDAVLARRLGVESASNRVAMRDCLVWSELRGGNHGLEKLVGMGEDATTSSPGPEPSGSGRRQPSPAAEGGGRVLQEPRVVREGPLAAEIDVDGCPGIAGLHLAAQVAGDKVRKGGGFALVRTRGTPAAGLEGTGAAGFYADLLADQGLVAMVACSCGPVVVRPFGGASPVFGTNPLAVGVPLGHGDFGNLILDMSTASVTLKDVRRARAEVNGPRLDADPPAEGARDGRGGGVMAAAAAAVEGSSLRAAAEAGVSPPPPIGFDAHSGAPTHELTRVGDLMAFAPGAKASGLAVMVQLLAGGGGEGSIWGNAVVAVDPRQVLLLEEDVPALGAARVVAALHAVGALAPGERGGRRRRAALDSGDVEIDRECLARLHALLL